MAYLRKKMPNPFLVGGGLEIWVVSDCTVHVYLVHVDSLVKIYFGRSVFPPLRQRGREKEKHYTTTCYSIVCVCVCLCQLNVFCQMLVMLGLESGQLERESQNNQGMKTTRRILDVLSLYLPIDWEICTHKWELSMSVFSRFLNEESCSMM